MIGLNFMKNYNVATREVLKKICLITIDYIKLYELMSLCCICTGNIMISGDITYKSCYYLFILLQKVCNFHM